MKATLCVLACLLLPMVPVRAVDAQTFTGGIRGVVSDANGVLPGATVTLTNEATNVSRDTVTNDVGQYNFPAVPPGYASRSSWPNYKTFDRTGLRIATQQFITLDVTLEVGTLAGNSHCDRRSRRSSTPRTRRPAARSTASSSRRCRRLGATRS